MKKNRYKLIISTFLAGVMLVGIASTSGGTLPNVSEMSEDDIMREARGGDAFALCEEYILPDLSGMSEDDIMREARGEYVAQSDDKLQVDTLTETISAFEWTGHDVQFTVYDVDGEYVESGVLEFNQNTDESGVARNVIPSLPVTIPRNGSVRFVPSGDERGWHVGANQWFCFAYVMSSSRTMGVEVRRNTSSRPGLVVQDDFVPHNASHFAYAHRAAQTGFYSVTLHNFSISSATFTSFSTRVEPTDTAMMAWIRARRIQ
ncbi:MAG: hypothetical protein FWF76_01980 [Oscillospiraceae bacterium]|nr:hypothetical protein [Oscillospiraceae bacterium]